MQNNNKRSLGRPGAGRLSVWVGLSILAASCGGGGGGGGSTGSSGTGSTGGTAGGTTSPTPATYSVSASVSGLSGSGLTLSYNGGNPVAVTASGTVSLATSLPNASAYSVTVATDPTSGQACALSNGSGTLSGANVSVQVACAAPTATTVTAVATGTINSAAGGTIAVSGQGPLGGAQIVVPANALGDPNDTLTISYSNTLPAALDSGAVAAGAVPVATVVTLSRSGTTRFASAVSVTIPYFTSLLGAADAPVVLYWDPTAGTYHAIQVTGIDRAAGTITFVTKHFSTFIAVGIAGLANMLQGSIPFTLTTTDSNFRPQTDGFEIENLSTQYTDFSNGGVCYGMTSYAAWYYTAKSRSSTHLYAKYSTPGLAGNSHIPQQDRIARELVHGTWLDTLSDNYAPLPNGHLRSLQEDADTVSALVQALQVTHAPQMITLTHLALSGGHSVLVYAWSADPASGPFSLKFSVYDPNYPGTEVQPLRWAPLTGFQPFQSVTGGVSYAIITFDAWSSHYDPDLLNTDFNDAEKGWSGPSFNTLTVASPAAVTPPAYPTPGVYPVPSSGTDVWVTWNCSTPPAPIPANVVVDNCKTSYVHAFLNSAPIGATQSIVPGQKVPISIPPLTMSSAELLVIISQRQEIDSDQYYISFGYDSFLSAVLITGAAGTCAPPAGETCSVTLYDIPDSTHSGFVAPTPGTITTVQTNNGVTTTVVNNQNPLGVTLYDNVNGPPLSAPVCNYQQGVCPHLSYHYFEACQVDGRWNPATYSSIVSSQVPFSTGNGTCTGQPERDDIITGYTLTADGVLTGTDTSTAGENSSCNVPYISGPGSYTTTYNLQNTKDDSISVNLKDGSGSATVSESRQSSSTNSLDPSQNSTSTTAVTGTQSWVAEAGTPTFPNMGIVATTLTVPAGQPLPPACTVSTP